MSQGPSLPASTILLIEADPSLRRLIMFGLCHSGIHVIEASSIQELPTLDAQTLDLLIIDVDQGVKSDWSLLSKLRERPHIATLPIVALSWENPAEEKESPPASFFSSLPFLSSRTILSSPSRRGSADLWHEAHRLQCLPNTASCLPAGDLAYLSKPFDARALHSTIAKLLAERAAQKAAQVAMVEACVLASYEQHSAPSIWPVITAAGLLLVVTGLLLHFLVVLIGVALMLTSLLLWTLGTKPAPSVSSPTASMMTLPHGV